jgi:ribosomal protein S25
MPNMTLSVSQDMYDRMKKSSEIRWSEVARKAFAEQIAKIELLEDLEKVKKARKEIADGKYITHSDLKKELGLK